MPADLRTSKTGRAGYTLTGRFGGPQLCLDERTGLPTGIAAGPHLPAIPVRFAVTLETDGRETAGPMGGLTYTGIRRHRAGAMVVGGLEHVSNGPEDTYRVLLDADGWLVRLTVTFRPDHPRIAVHLAASPAQHDDDHRDGRQGEEAILRDLVLDVDLAGPLNGWLVEAPGNKLRPGATAAALTAPVTMQTAGHELGSPGIVALHHPDQPVTVAVWPLSRSEQGQLSLEPAGAGLRVRLRTQLAGAVRRSEWLEHGPVYIDALGQPWHEVRGQIFRWYDSVGIATPADRPEWASATSIYEVMIGYAPFYDGYRYAPYPDLSDLLADLDHIASLGFDCLQLMPRHPYPSYNIHQPGDAATTYAPPDQLRQLVHECHTRGLRIILDVLLHGVLDRESMRKAVDVVKSGPHADRLDDPCADVYDIEDVEISWARHILAYETAWLEGSPEHHPMLDAHPDWFMRDSSGQITGVYTHALDIANPHWQNHFITSCETLIREYGIDGFRLDAPLYNRFANWSPATRHHASYSSMGALHLLKRLRRRLHALSPNLLLYSEPGGALARESLDLCYGYEAAWLPASLYDPRMHARHDWRRVRTGQELAAWFRDFDAALPPGSVSAHFVDCHDTIWWRLADDHWRREQIGLPATKALIAIYALRGGGYLTAAGGETGIETELRRVHVLRTHLPEIRHGAVDYNSVHTDSGALYTVLRRDHHRATLVAVNTSARAVDGRVHVNTAAMPGQLGREVFDAWTDRWLPTPAPGPGPGNPEGGTLAFDLPFEPYQASVIILGHPPRELRP
jgi:glycosidase